MSNTPGPWHQSFKTTRTNNLGVYDQHGMLIADLAVHQLANTATIHRRVADARLIAAAPQQHDALLAVLHAPNFNTLDDATKNAVRAAIAKATGETE